MRGKNQLEKTRDTPEILAERQGNMGFKSFLHMRGNLENLIYAQDWKDVQKKSKNTLSAYLQLTSSSVYTGK